MAMSHLGSVCHHISSSKSSAMSARIKGCRKATASSSHRKLAAAAAASGFVQPWLLNAQTFLLRMFRQRVTSAASGCVVNGASDALPGNPTCTRSVYWKRFYVQQRARALSGIVSDSDENTHPSSSQCFQLQTLNAIRYSVGLWRKQAPQFLPMLSSANIMRKESVCHGSLTISTHVWK
jgi:hypothetical protein